MGEGINKYGTRTARRENPARPTAPETKVRVNTDKAKTLAAAAAKRDVNAGLNSKQIATLHGIESKHATRATEQINFVDENGKVIFSKNGTRSSVKLYPTESSLMKDMVVTHNHPSDSRMGKGMAMQIGQPINGIDLAGAIRHNAKEIRASAQGYVFSVKRPQGGWNANPDQVQRDFMREWRSEQSRSLGYIYKGDRETALTRNARWNVATMNAIMRRLSKQYGFNYTRRRM